jgi:hypothetical protein
MKFIIQQTSNDIAVINLPLTVNDDYVPVFNLGLQTITVNNIALDMFWGWGNSCPVYIFYRLRGRACVKREVCIDGNGAWWRSPVIFWKVCRFGCAINIPGEICIRHFKGGGQSNTVFIATYSWVKPRFSRNALIL